MVAAGIIGFLTFMDWAHLRYVYAASDGNQLTATAGLSGFGMVHVDIPGVASVNERQLVERQEADALLVAEPIAPGLPAVVALALPIASAAVAYLRTRHRSIAAIAIVVLSMLGLIYFVYRIVRARDGFRANVALMNNEPAAWSSAHFSPGCGPIAATVVAVALAGLGVTALVLERRANPSLLPRDHYSRRQPHLYPPGGRRR